MSIDDFVKMNSVTLSGEVVSIPNSRSSRTGGSYTIFTLAVGPVTPARPFRIAVVAEDLLGERCKELLARGSAVIVEGLLRGAPGRSQALRAIATRVQLRSDSGEFLDLALQAPETADSTAIADEAVVEQSKLTPVDRSKEHRKPAPKASKIVENARPERPAKAAAKPSSKALTKPSAKSSTELSTESSVESSTPNSREGFGRSRRPVKPEIPIETLALGESEKEKQTQARAQKTKRPARKRPTRKRAGASDSSAKTSSKATHGADGAGASTPTVLSSEQSGVKGIGAKKKSPRPRKPRKQVSGESKAKAVVSTDKPVQTTSKKTSEKPVGKSPNKRTARDATKSGSKAGSKASPKKPRGAKTVKKEEVSDSPFALRDVEDTFDPFLIETDE